MEIPVTDEIRPYVAMMDQAVDALENRSMYTTYMSLDINVDL